MTNKIEQEFFKAFDIRYKQEWCCTPTGEYSKNGEILEKSNLIKFYPPITPEIILKLEEIAMGAIWLYGGDRLIYTNENGVHKYFAENYSDKVCIKADSKQEALLKLFLHGYAIRKEDVANQILIEIGGSKWVKKKHI